MSLIIMDNSLVTYALSYSIDNCDDHERSTWICNRIQENIHHIDQATLLHIKQLINDHVNDDWSYLEAAPFKRLRTYVVEQLKVYA